MTFWNDRSIKVNQRHRYKLQIGDLFWWVKTVKFPSISSETTEFSEGVSAYKKFAPGSVSTDAFSITFSDVILTNTDDNNIVYSCSSGAFMFWLFKYLEAGAKNKVISYALEDGNYNPQWPFSLEFADSYLNRETGKVKTIKIIKFYGDDQKEAILAFNSVITKVDLGQGDYSSEEINEITVDFQPDGLRIDTYITDNEEGDTRQEVYDNPVETPSPQDTSSSSSPSENNTNRPRSNNQSKETNDIPTDSSGESFW